MTEAKKTRILKALVHRLRSARQFFHVGRPTTFQEVGNFRLAAQRFIHEFGEDWELQRFDQAWHDAFVTPPQKGRIDKADDLDGDVGMCHPGLARLALKTLIGVMRRFEGQAPLPPPPQSMTEQPVPATVAVKSATVPSVRAKPKRGPKPDTDNYQKVAAIIRQHGDDWQMDEKLQEICAALDEAKVPPPPHWAKWTPNRARTWSRGLNWKPRLVVQALEYRLKQCPL